jgi:hypothetical protein
MTFIAARREGFFATSRRDAVAVSALAGFMLSLLGLLFMLVSKWASSLRWGRVAPRCEGMLANPAFFRLPMAI